MTGNDIDRLRGAFRPRDLAVALALLTRLPLPAAAFPADGTRPAARAAWAYPLAGLVVAALGLLAGGAAAGLGMPLPVQVLCVLLACTLVTGAMHEDGLADCADGFWGGWTVDRRLEIMKDSQIGSYGVIALIVALGLRWQALTILGAADLLAPALIGAAVISRAAMVAVMAALPNARHGGLSARTGRPGGPALAAAVAFGCLAALAVGAPIALLVTAAGLTVGVAALARRKIGGQTGDVLGATQQVVELGVLLVLLR